MAIVFVATIFLFEIRIEELLIINKKTVNC